MIDNGERQRADSHRAAAVGLSWALPRRHDTIYEEISPLAVRWRISAAIDDLIYFLATHDMPRPSFLFESAAMGGLLP